MILRCYLIVLICLSTICLTETTLPSPVQHCNLTTRSNPILKPLEGSLFVATSDATGDKYYFSLCGFIPQSNESLVTWSSTPEFLKRNGSNVWIPILSNSHTFDLIQNKTTRLLKFTPSSDPLAACTVLVELSCLTPTQNFNVLIDDMGKSQPCVVFAKLSYSDHHDHLCIQKFNWRVLFVIFLTLTCLIPIYFLLGTFYNKCVYKQSWSGSVPHIRLFNRLNPSIVRLRRNRRTNLLEPQYVRLPTDESTTTITTITEEEQKTLMKSERATRSQPIVLEDEPQDDLLLSL